MSNLCSLSSTVCPIRLPLNKYPTNELIVNLVNLLLTDYVGNQEDIFFPNIPARKLSPLKHPSELDNFFSNSLYHNIS